MKKRNRIILTVIIAVFFILFVGLGLIGDYFCNIALSVRVDNSNIFEGSGTQNAKEGPKRKDNSKWLKEESEYQDAYITSKDNLKLHAYEIKNKADTNNWVIDIHGYRGEAKEMSDSAFVFYEKGFNVLMPDLRGHGQSEGNYVGMGWIDREDILQWIDYIIQKDSNAKIALYGVSMGGATVAMTTGENLPENVKVAIEDCGYSSVWDEFAYMLQNIYHLPTFPVLNAASLVSKIKINYFLEDADTIKQVKKSKTPTLFIHGDQDKFVPFEMLDKIYEAASCPKEKLVINGAEHALSSTIAPDIYWTKVFEFIQKHMD